MQSNAQLALPLYETAEAEALAYHNPSRFGYVAVLTRNSPKDKMCQRMYALNELSPKLQRLAQGIDAYISPSEFKPGGRRTLANLIRLTSMFIDLDTYKVSELCEVTPECLAERLLMLCREKKLPPPSLIIFTGRGLQAKWILEKPIPWKALRRWDAIQRHIFVVLKEMGADPLARSAVQVLRIVDTVNTKNGVRTRVLYQNTTAASGAVLAPGGLAVYDFETLQAEILPYTREQVAIWKADKQARLDARVLRRTTIKVHTEGLTKFDPKDLAFDRLVDLRYLMELRGYSAGLPDGQRNLFVFLASCFLAFSTEVGDLRGEVLSFAAEFAPHWTEARQRRCYASVQDRLTKSRAGKTIKFNGLDVDPRYRFRNRTLIELLGITPEEQQHLKTIISPEEAARRHAERCVKARREAGAV